MKKFDVEATTDNLEKVIAFIDSILEEHECSMKEQMQVELTVEEIFVNIASYAYAPETGMAEIEADISDEPKLLTVTFSDRGKPYDPLANEDPDVTLPASERRIGGLGIFLVKKNMDDVRYRFDGGKNILTVTKALS